MKQLTFLVAAIFTLSSVFAQTETPVEFKETKFSFGKIKQNVPATHVFTFKNVSDKVVVIENATAGCGCTTPEFPKNAIAPGSSEKIKVTYNAAAMGAFTKDVTVKVAKLNEPIILKIEGEVVAAENSVATVPEVKPTTGGNVKVKPETAPRAKVAKKKS